MCAVAENDRGWLAALVSLESWLHGWLRRRYPSADTDELVQDTYLRLCSLEEDPGIGSHKAYLSRTAMSVAIDHARRANTRSICVPLGEDVLEQACSRPLADVQFDAKQQLMRVKGALAELPVRQRQVVMMRRIDGMRSKEVAASLGLSVSSVEKYMTRSMRRLAEAL